MAEKVEKVKPEQMAQINHQPPLFKGWMDIPAEIKPGVFLSPTRNLSNNSRFVRHINPWNYPVKVHTYDEYEEEFRDKMIEAGLPVEKEETAE